MIDVRPYRPDDVASVADLMHDLGYPTSAEKMKRRMETIAAVPLYATFVATLEGRVAGMIGLRQIYYYEEDGNTMQVSLLVTKKEFEGRGVGKALIRFAENWAREHGSNALNLTSGIKPERERAHRFYEAMGFVTTGYRFVKRLE